MIKNRKNIWLVSFLFLIIFLAFFLLIQIKKSHEISENFLLQPKSLTFDHSLDKTNLDKMIWGARVYYTFWNTGDFKYLNAVISPTFIDHTLSSNALQGPQGLKDFLNQLRFAIPNLSCSIEELLITGDKVTARIRLQGTSKFSYQGHAPTHKPIEYIAIDILHFQDGKIVDAWRVSDRLAFYEQLNLVSELPKSA